MLAVSGLAPFLLRAEPVSVYLLGVVTRLLFSCNVQRLFRVIAHEKYPTHNLQYLPIARSMRLCLAYHTQIYGESEY